MKTTARRYHREFLILLTFVLLAAFSSFASGQKVYSADEAEKHIGDSATVTGKVYQVFTSKKGTTFLDIGADYPNNPFAAVIFEKDSSMFRNVQQYEGKTVAITGKIIDYNGAAEIVLNSADQIKIQSTKDDDKGKSPKDSL